jgi:adenylosuccinate lyase
MDLSLLTAISPLDGRYRATVAPLSPYFSEFALIRYRVLVEIEYLLALCESGIKPLPSLQKEEVMRMRSWYQDFSESDAQSVKALERETNHDVKAVEYFLKKKLAAEGPESLRPWLEFVHFGLTSQDINNTAIPLLLKEAIQTVILPEIQTIVATLNQQAQAWAKVPMLARTHGQPATPTTLGKELSVFAERIHIQTQTLAQLPYPAKFGGASGNLNAHYAAYPQVDWAVFAKNFVASLGLTRSYPTTQIEHYDGLAAILDNLKRINVILQDLCQDVWLYVSMDYFKQQVKAGEVGSSAMPHKVNPIDFENAEGNVGLSNALLEYMSRKLPVSRLQRDLTDSTVLRNLGPALGYGLLALKSVQRGLGKLLLNKAALATDLSNQWAILAEPIQTILRREGYPEPYEALKALTRGRIHVTESDMHGFVQTLDVSDSVKSELLALRPDTYLGDAAGVPFRTVE